MTTRCLLVLAIALTMLIPAGCSSRKEPPPVAQPQAGKGDMERLQAENQWLREELDKAKNPQAATAEAAVKGGQGQPAKGTVATTPAAPAEKSGRKVAQWVVKLGGSLSALVGQKLVEMRCPDDVPSGDFPATTIRTIDLFQKPVSDDDLKRLHGLSGLRVLALRFRGFSGLLK